MQSLEEIPPCELYNWILQKQHRSDYVYIYEIFESGEFEFHLKQAKLCQLNDAVSACKNKQVVSVERTLAAGALEVVGAANEEDGEKQEDVNPFANMEPLIAADKKKAKAAANNKSKKSKAAAAGGAPVSKAAGKAGANVAIAKTEKAKPKQNAAALKKLTKEASKMARASLTAKNISKNASAGATGGGVIISAKATASLGSFANNPVANMLKGKVIQVQKFKKPLAKNMVLRNNSPKREFLGRFLKQVDVKKMSEMGGVVPGDAAASIKPPTVEEQFIVEVFGQRADLEPVKEGETGTDAMDAARRYSVGGRPIRYNDMQDRVHMLRRLDAEENSRVAQRFNKLRVRGSDGVLQFHGREMVYDQWFQPEFQLVGGLIPAGPAPLRANLDMHGNVTEKESFRGWMQHHIACEHRVVFVIRQARRPSQFSAEASPQLTEAQAEQVELAGGLDPKALCAVKGTTTSSSVQPAKEQDPLRDQLAALLGREEMTWVLQPEQEAGATSCGDEGEEEDGENAAVKMLDDESYEVGSCPNRKESKFDANDYYQQMELDGEGRNQNTVRNLVNHPEDLENWDRKHHKGVTVSRLFRFLESVVETNVAEYRKVNFDRRREIYGNSTRAERFRKMLLSNFSFCRLQEHSNEVFPRFLENDKPVKYDDKMPICAYSSTPGQLVHYASGYSKAQLENAGYSVPASLNKVDSRMCGVIPPAKVQINTLFKLADSQKRQVTLCDEHEKLLELKRDGKVPHTSVFPASLLLVDVVHKKESDRSLKQSFQHLPTFYHRWSRHNAGCKLVDIDAKTGTVTQNMELPPELDERMVTAYTQEQHLRRTPTDISDKYMMRFPQAALPDLFAGGSASFDPKILDTLGITSVVSCIRWDKAGEKLKKEDREQAENSSCSFKQQYETLQPFLQREAMRRSVQGLPRFNLNITLEDEATYPYELFKMQIYQGLRFLCLEMKGLAAHTIAKRRSARLAQSFFGSKMKTLMDVFAPAARRAQDWQDAKNAPPMPLMSKQTIIGHGAAASTSAAVDKGAANNNSGESFMNWLYGEGGELPASVMKDAFVVPMEDYEMQAPAPKKKKLNLPEKLEIQMKILNEMNYFQLSRDFETEIVSPEFDQLRAEAGFLPMHPSPPSFDNDVDVDKEEWKANTISSRIAKDLIEDGIDIQEKKRPAVLDSDPNYQSSMNQISAKAMKESLVKKVELGKKFDVISFDQAFQYHQKIDVYRQQSFRVIENNGMPRLSFYELFDFNDAERHMVERYADSCYPNHLLDDCANLLKRELSEIYGEHHDGNDLRQKVLIHCTDGRCLSSCLIVAYLMFVSGVGFEAAFFYLKKNHHRAHIRDEYIKHLELMRKERCI
eukprot:g9082.t1